MKSFCRALLRPTIDLKAKQVSPRAKRITYFAVSAVLTCFALPVQGFAQTPSATVAVGTFPSAIAVNPTTNKIYVANFLSANVTVIDGATNTTTPVAAGTNPFGLAVNPVTNKIYVGNYGSNNVTVIDGATNTTTPVAAGTNPFGLAVNSVTNKIYVANEISNNVTVVDGASNNTTTVAAGTFPTAVAVNPVTNKIYVGNYGSNNVTVIDGASDSTTTVPAGSGPLAVAVNPVTNKIYVANQNSNNVTLIDGATNTTTTITVGINQPTNDPFDVAVNSVTNKIYVANEFSVVTVIDGVTNSTTPVVAGLNPLAVAVNSVTNKIYVANDGSNNVTVIDGATNSTATVAAGTNPVAVAVNSVSNKTYVANQGSNTVTVIGGACGSGPTFAEVVQSGVATPLVVPGTISTNFQPGFGLSLTEAACLGGYDHFNWKQTVLSFNLLLVCPLCVTPGLLYLPEGSVLPTLPQAPFIDPPHGGYEYLVADKCSPFPPVPGVCWFPVRDDFDWYWDEKYADNGKLPDPKSSSSDLRVTELAFHTPSSNMLEFLDTPRCPAFLNAFGVADLCIIYFSTNLVGVRDGTGEVLALPGTGFNWHLVGTTISVEPRLSATGPIDTGTLVYSDGFKPPGVAGFTQPELELFAKSGIRIRDESGAIIPVIIDIKPGELPNSINPQSSGTIPVAIISTNGFRSPNEIDQKSLTFGHTGDESSLAFCQSEDVNGDGLIDLVCHFYPSKAGFQSSDKQGILKGKALSGISLYGRDSVRIVTPH